MIKLLTFVLVLFMTVPIMAQEASPAPPTAAQADAPAKLPIVPDEKLTKLQLLDSNRLLLETQSTLLQKAYQEQIKKMQDDYTKILADLSARKTALLMELKLDPTKFDIELASGQVVSTAKPDKK